MTHKLKDTVNGARLGKLHTHMSGRNKNKPEQNFTREEVSTLLCYNRYLIKLSDNKTAAASLFKLIDNHTNLNLSWFVLFPHHPSTVF